MRLLKNDGMVAHYNQNPPSIKPSHTVLLIFFADYGLVKRLMMRMFKLSILQSFPRFHQSVPDQLDLGLMRYGLEIRMEDGFLLVGWFGGAVAVDLGGGVEGLDGDGGKGQVFAVGVE